MPRTDEILKQMLVNEEHRLSRCYAFQINLSSTHVIIFQQKERINIFSEMDDSLTRNKGWISTNMWNGYLRNATEIELQFSIHEHYYGRIICWDLLRDWNFMLSE